MKAFPAERLEQIIYRAGLKSADRILVERRCKDHGGYLVEKLQHFEAIDLGHLYVEEHQVGRMLLDGLYTFVAIVAFGHYSKIFPVLQVFQHDAAGQGFIIDDDNFFHWGIFNVVIKWFSFLSVLKR